jgi:hypothetical protein
VQNFSGSDKERDTVQAQTAVVNAPQTTGQAEANGCASNNFRLQFVFPKKTMG